MCFNPETPIDQSWFMDLSAQRTAVLRWSYQSGLYMAYVLIDLPEDVEEFPAEYSKPYSFNFMQYCHKCKMW